MPMRVAFVIPSLDGGGAEVVVRRWADALSDGGDEVLVYTYMGDADAAPTNSNVRYIHKRHGTRWNRLLLPFWVWTRVRRDTPDAVVAALTFTNLAVLVGLKIIPF